MRLKRLLRIPIILSCIIWGGITFTSIAQPVELGIFGGANMSTHLGKFKYATNNINLVRTPKITTGYQAGFIARKEITDFLRVQLEPSLILLGARYEESFVLGGVNYETKGRSRLLYIQAPLVFQLSTIPSSSTVYGQPFSKTTYHLSGGVFGGYLPYARYKGTNRRVENIDYRDDFLIDISDQYQEYDGGVLFGLGLEHGYKHKLGLEARALYSIIDSGNAPELDFHPQNLAFTVSAYYLF